MSGPNGQGGNRLQAGPDRNQPTTASRKADHIRINLEEDVDAKGVTSGFDGYRFLHCALPEIDLAQVDLGTTLFGRRVGAPLFISCMTGGVAEAGRINRTLAEVAQALRLPLGLGSGRVQLEHDAPLPGFDVRGYAPDVPIFANLGAVQLNLGKTVTECRRLLELTRADALVLHLNPLQEALQLEGDTVFGGLLDRIEELCRRLEAPVVVKEVGWGLAPDVVRSLLEAGVAAIDVAGAGGTSWSEVERHRLSDPHRAAVAQAFAGWGIPTAQALRLARQAAPTALIFASGGVRDGLDLAKAIALGANLVGMAGPFLRAAAAGPEGALALAREMIDVLRITMFCLGAPTPQDLRATPRLLDSAGQPVSPLPERRPRRVRA